MSDGAKESMELLPCPFCGEGPAVNLFELGTRTIFCATNDCMGPSTTAYSIEDAAAQWNTRATPAQSNGDEGLKRAQYIAEGIILRRLHEKRIEGYTIETAKEIAEAILAGEIPS